MGSTSGEEAVAMSGPIGMLLRFCSQKGLPLSVVVFAVLVWLSKRRWPEHYCQHISSKPPSSNDVDWCKLCDSPAKDIELKGFTVIRNFVSRSSVKNLLALKPKLEDDGRESPY